MAVAVVRFGSAVAVGAVAVGDIRPGKSAGGVASQPEQIKNPPHSLFLPSHSPCTFHGSEIFFHPKNGDLEHRKNIDVTSKDDIIRGEHTSFKVGIAFWRVSK